MVPCCLLGSRRWKCLLQGHVQTGSLFVALLSAVLFALLLLGIYMKIKKKGCMFYGQDMSGLTVNLGAAFSFATDSEHDLG